MCDHGYIGPCLEGCDLLPPCKVCGRKHDECVHDGDEDAEREAAHERGMEKWARRYDDLNGAPEGWEDR